MTLFLDASAIAAVVGREPEATRFGEVITFDEDRLTSALAIWEATRAVARLRGVEFQEARLLVRDFIHTIGARIVAIDEEAAELALDAHERYGRGRHPADLNFGDCFSYACAKQHGALILFKGDDFAETDLKDATLA